MSLERVPFELSKEYLDLVLRAIEQKDDAFIRDTMEGVNPADISALLDEVETDEARYVLDVLANEVGAEVIEELEEDTRKDFLEELEPEEIARYIVEMESDDAVDIINDLTQRELLSSPKIIPRYFNNDNFTTKLNAFKEGITLSKMI